MGLLLNAAPWGRPRAVIRTGHVTAAVRLTLALPAAALAAAIDRTETTDRYGRDPRTVLDRAASSRAFRARRRRAVAGRAPTRGMGHERRRRPAAPAWP
jgi:hypothetical protein